MSTSRYNSLQSAFCVVLALALGLGIGWLDPHTTEVSVTIGALLLAGFLLGLLQPNAAWRWAVLLALGLPLMGAIGIWSGTTTAEPIHVDPRIALIALGLSLVGCYSGAVLRRAVI